MALTEKYVTQDGAGDGTGSSEGNARSWANMVADIVAAGAGGSAGLRYNIKGAISRTTTTDTISGGGTVASPCVLRGYNSTIGDGYQGRTSGAGLVTTNMPAISYTSGRLICSATFMLLEAINLTGATNNNVISVGAGSALKSCVITNTGTGASSGALTLSTVAQATVFDCDVSLTGASGGTSAITAQGASQRVVACRIRGGNGIGVSVRSTAVVAMNTIFASTGNHIYMDNNSGSPAILFNTLVGGGADAINIITGSTTLQCVIGNMMTDNTGDGLDMVSTSNGAFAAYNRYRDNANSQANAGDWLTATNYGDVDSGTTGTTATDYTNYAGNDYRLVTGASPSPAVGAAQPASASIGALQPAQAAASAGGGSYAFIG